MVSPTEGEDEEGDCVGVLEGSTVGSTLGSDEGAAVVDMEEGAGDCAGLNA